MANLVSSSALFLLNANDLTSDSVACTADSNTCDLLPVFTILASRSSRLIKILLTLHTNVHTGVLIMLGHSCEYCSSLTADIAMLSIVMMLFSKLTIPACFSMEITFLLTAFFFIVLWSEVTIPLACSQSVVTLLVPPKVNYLVRGNYVVISF